MQTIEKALDALKTAMAALVLDIHQQAAAKEQKSVAVELTRKLVAWEHNVAAPFRKKEHNR